MYSSILDCTVVYTVVNYSIHWCAVVYNSALKCTFVFFIYIRITYCRDKKGINMRLMKKVEKLLKPSHSRMNKNIAEFSAVLPFIDWKHKPNKCIIFVNFLRWEVIVMVKSRVSILPDKDFHSGNGMIWKICFVKWNFSSIRYVTQKCFRFTEWKFPEEILFVFRIPEKNQDRSIPGVMWVLGSIGSAILSFFWTQTDEYSIYLDELILRRIWQW